MTDVLAALIEETMAEHRSDGGPYRTSCSCGWAVDEYDPRLQRAQHRAHVAQVVSTRIGAEQVASGVTFTGGLSTLGYYDDFPHWRLRGLEGENRDGH